MYELQLSPLTTSGGCTPLIKALLEKDETTCIGILESECTTINTKNDVGWTALHIACRNNLFDFVTMLLDHGADPNIQEDSGWTSLIMASRYSKLAIVKTLLDHGANMNSKDEDGMAPLMHATRYVNNESDKETVNILLEYGADPNLQDNLGITALMEAARYSKTESSDEIVRLLLKHGANPDLQENDGWTALMKASAHSNLTSSDETIKILLTGGANPNIKNNDGWTPLMIAAQYDFFETIKILLLHGTNVNLQENDGHTALHILIFEKSSEETIKMLIENGADPTIKNNKREDVISETLKFIIQKVFTLEKEIKKVTKENELLKLSPMPGETFIKLFREEFSTEDKPILIEKFIDAYSSILRSHLQTI
jgi:ankyrin repeat protein